MTSTLANSREPSLFRAGLIGDIHCEDKVLERVLEHFSELGTETVLAVGDVVDGTGDVNRVCSLLIEHGVLAVMGNHDRWILQGRMRELPDATAIDALRRESRCWLEQLPKTRSFQTPRGPLLLCHGLGEDDMGAVRQNDIGYALESNSPLLDLVRSKQHRFVVNGHTHEPMVRNVGQLTVINAGTLNRGYRQVCSVIDFERDTVEFFDAGKIQIASAECFQLAGI